MDSAVPAKDGKGGGQRSAFGIAGNQQPVAYGYHSALLLDSAEGLFFAVSNLVVDRNILTAKEYKPSTDRGGPDEDDTPWFRLTRDGKVLLFANNPFTVTKPSGPTQ